MAIISPSGRATRGDKQAATHHYSALRSYWWSWVAAAEQAAPLPRQIEQLTRRTVALWPRSCGGQEVRSLAEHGQGGGTARGSQASPTSTPLSRAARISSSRGVAPKCANQTWRSLLPLCLRFRRCLGTLDFDHNSFVCRALSTGFPFVPRRGQDAAPPPLPAYNV